MPTRNLSFLAERYYHIYNRGVNREQIFFLQANYLYLLRLLKKNLARYTISIAAYCLMPNHYHLLLKSEQDDMVSPFMKSVFGAYTQAINRQQGRQGPLFQGRFRAVWVDREGYFEHLACYIHANPVLAGLSDSPQAWIYSNYLGILGMRNGTLKNDDLIPGCFPTGIDYQRFVEDYVTYRQELDELELYTFDCSFREALSFPEAEEASNGEKSTYGNDRCWQYGAEPLAPNLATDGDDGDRGAL